MWATHTMDTDLPWILTYIGVLTGNLQKQRAAGNVCSHAVEQIGDEQIGDDERTVRIPRVGT